VRTEPRIEVSEVDAGRPPASELLAAMTAELDRLYERVEGSLHSVPATPEQMSPPDGCFLLLSRAGEPLACGGIKRLGAGLAEIKRMYVVPEHRNEGLGRRLLVELERRCAELGYGRVRLDTGPDQPSARRIYEAAGYVSIPDYNGNPYAAHWFEKRLG
jgi:GNAT superfamily N-acetyltransferase